jgi:hypothetical protein
MTPRHATIENGRLIFNRCAHERRALKGIVGRFIFACPIRLLFVEPGGGRQ